MLIKLLILLFVSTNVWSADPPPTLYDEGTKQGVIFNFNCTGDGITCSRSGITGTLNVAASGSGGVGVGTVSPGVINRIAYYPGTTNVTLDDLAALTTDGTNIGIGTTGPRQKLEVNGSQYASGNVGIGTSAVSAAAPLEITRLGTTTSLMISSPGQDGDLLKFDGNGNLGIGTTTTTSPTKLMVNGSSLFSNTMTLSVAPDTNADNFIFKKQGAVSASNIQFSNSHRSNNTDFWLYGYDGSTFKNFSGYFYDTHKVLFGPSGTGANTLVADLANSNVGVGTVNPVNKLEVVGTAQVDGFKLDTNPSAGYVLVSGSTGIGTWMSPSSIGAGGGGSSKWASTAVGIGTYERVGIGTVLGNASLAIMPGNNGGNVGIGTWNPTAALEVKGNIRLPIGQGALYQQGTTSQTAQEVFNITTIDTNAGGIARPVMAYFEHAVNPGSAVTSDFHTIDAKIYGSSANINQNTRLYAIEGKVQNQAASGNIQGGGVGVFGSSTLIGIGTTSNNIGVQAETQVTAAGTIVNGMGIQVKSPTISGGGAILNNYGIKIENQTGATVDNYALFTGTGTSYFGGNVGIGSADPTQSLDVAGTIRATTDILVGAQSVCQEDGTNCPASAPAAPAGGTGAVQYNNAGTTAGAEAVFSFNGTNVGIGTTNGRQLLEVNGRSWFQNNVGIGTLAPSNSGLAMLHIVQSNTASGANGAVALRVDDTDAEDQSPFAVTDGGYVGIGTFKPTARLHIKGSTDAGFTQETTDDSLSTSMRVDTDNNQANDYNSIEFRRNSDANVSWVIGQNGANSGNFNIRYGGSDMSAGSAAFVINSSGNIGMGLTNQNPAAILDISTTANQNLFVVEDNGDGDTTPFLIDATGNVGIGTTSTQTKVAILGGNVGIGTWTATNASLETTGLRVFNQGEAAGRVLVSNSLGIGTWMTASSIGAGGSGTNYWSLSAGTGNVGINTTQSVGIGTTLSNNGALVVMPVQSGTGNVGIGTWNPTGALEVKGSGVNTFSTNVGIGTSVGVPNALYVVGTPMFTAGLNIGIGTASPTRLCIANGAIAVCP